MAPVSHSTDSCLGRLVGNPNHAAIVSDNCELESCVSKSLQKEERDQKLEQIVQIRALEREHCRGHFTTVDARQKVF